MKRLDARDPDRTENVWNGKKDLTNPVSLPMWRSINKLIMANLLIKISDFLCFSINTRAERYIDMC